MKNDGTEKITNKIYISKVKKYTQIMQTFKCEHKTKN